MNDSTPILTEADTCRELVTPAIRQAGWGQAPYAIGEQHQITDGRILLIGGKARREGRQDEDGQTQDSRGSFRERGEHSAAFGILLQPDTVGLVVRVRSAATVRMKLVP